MNDHTKTKAQLVAEVQQLRQQLADIPQQPADGAVPQALAAMLHQAEAKYRSLFDHAPIGIGVSMDGRIILSNARDCELFGFAHPSEMVGRRVSDLIHPDDLPAMLELGERLLRGEVRMDAPVIFRGQRPDGRPIVIEGISLLFPYEGATALLSFHRDVTEQEQVEAARRASEANLAALIDSTDDRIWSVDRRYCLTTANAAFRQRIEQRLGRAAQPGDCVFYAELSPEVIDEWRAYYYRALAGEKFAVERETFGDAGSEWIDYHFNPIVADGQIVGVTVLGRNITGRKRAEAASLEAEQRFRNMFERHQAIMLLIEPDSGAIVDANAAAAAFYGYPLAELRRMNIEAINCLPPEQVAAERHHAVIEQRNYFIFPHRLAGGEIRTVEVHSTPIAVGDRTLLFSIIHDITERRRAEAELGISLEKYRVLFESFPLGISISDHTGRVLEANQAADRILGVPRDEHARRAIDGPEWRIIRRDGTPMPPEEFASVRALAEQRVVGNVEMGIVKGPEAITWLSVTAAPIPLPGYGVAITYGDISDRIRVETTLRQNEANLQALMSAADESILLLELDGTIIALNDIAATRFRLTVAQMLGRSIYDFVPPETGAERRNFSAQVIATGQPIRFTDERLGRWMDSYINPVCDERGQVTRLAVFSRDITESKQTEGALRESEARYRLIADTVSDIVWRLDTNLRFVYTSPAVEQVFGYTPAEMVNFPVLNLLDEEGIAQTRRVTQARLSGMPGDAGATEYRMKHKDGHWVDVEVVSSVLRDDQNRLAGFAGITRNITERKRAEAELAQRAAELARSNADLAQFAHVASHDLQEPLRMVSSYLQLLERRYRGQLDATADEFIAFAVDGTRRMQRLITDLLAYSRVGAGAQLPGPTDCQAALQQALNNLQIALQDSRAAVTHDPLPAVLADPGEVTQLFQNLIGNAVKFRGAEPPRVHISAQQIDDFRLPMPDAISPGANRQCPELRGTLSTIGDRKSVWVFAVRDNGIGIEPRQFERIFMIFQRLHTPAEYPGTGIGLAICKKIVERHGGCIWVESQPGQGATFFFTLPAAA